MAISREQEAEILRLHQAEGWTVNTIASQLGVHHSTVGRLLTRNGLKAKRSCRSIIDPYVGFIQSTLKDYPKLTATRLYHMVKERGYPGGVDYFRDIVGKYRPHNHQEAYLRLTTLPGEQAQVDWGHFGQLEIGSASRKLYAFVMVLSWSRRIFLRFYLDSGTANFLRGHVEAFNHFEAVPREILYDNLKSAVIERVGSAIHFNPELLSLASHYRFGPKPVGVRKPNEKGRVERAIQYVRSGFFAARDFSGIEGLNLQADNWCKEEATRRRCPADQALTIAEAFAKEKAALLALPDVPYAVYDRKPVYVGKTPYIRFDLNDYSVPHTQVGKKLLVEATLDEVRITDGLHVVAIHPRSYEKGKQVDNKEHTDELRAVKQEARKGNGLNRLHHVVPSSVALFKKAAERGDNLGRLTQLLIKMLDLYGAGELEAALSEVLAAGVMHIASIQHVLERRRQSKGLPPPVALSFSCNSRFTEMNVVPKSLDVYDRLLKQEDVADE